MLTRSVDGRAVVMTARCQRCADDHPEVTAPALVELRDEGDGWWVSAIFEPRRGKREGTTPDELLGEAPGRARRGWLERGAKGVELRCRVCGARPRVGLEDLKRRAESARARQTSTFTLR